MVLGTSLSAAFLAEELYIFVHCPVGDHLRHDALTLFFLDTASLEALRGCLLNCCVVLGKHAILKSFFLQGILLSALLLVDLLGVIKSVDQGGFVQAILMNAVHLRYMLARCLLEAGRGADTVVLNHHHLVEGRGLLLETAVGVLISSQ